MVYNNVKGFFVFNFKAQPDNGTYGLRCCFGQIIAFAINNLEFVIPVREKVKIVFGFDDLIKGDLTLNLRCFVWTEQLFQFIAGFKFIVIVAELKGFLINDFLIIDNNHPFCRLIFCFCNKFDLTWKVCKTRLQKRISNEKSNLQYTYFA